MGSYDGGGAHLIRRTRATAQTSILIGIRFPAVPMRLVLTLLAALVLSVRPSAAQIVTGGAASGVFGQPSFTARELPFFTDVEPGGVVADARRGLLYVSDPARNRVLRYDTRTAPATHGPASGVLGQPGFASGTPATSRTGMNGPGALALDASGRLYVADG